LRVGDLIKFGRVRFRITKMHNVRNGYGEFKQIIDNLDSNLQIKQDHSNLEDELYSQTSQ